MFRYDKVIFKSKTARTIFFIIFVGGLFTFSSIIFRSLCNEVIFDYFQFPCISYLESAGVLAFGYIFAFGIKFGLGKVDMTDSLMSNRQKNANMTSNCQEHLKKMTDKEKDQLKLELEKRCGIKQSSH